MPPTRRRRLHRVQEDDEGNEDAASLKLGSADDAMYFMEHLTDYIPQVMNFKTQIHSPPLKPSFLLMLC